MKSWVTTPKLKIAMSQNSSIIHDFQMSTSHWKTFPVMLHTHHPPPTLTTVTKPIYCRRRFVLHVNVDPLFISN